MSQLVEFVDHDYLKGFLLFRVELLGTSDFFNQFLHDDAVVVVSLGGSDLDVVERREDVGFACGRRSGANFELFGFRLHPVHCICVVEGLQETLCESSLSGSTGTIEQNVREVFAL